MALVWALPLAPRTFKLPIGMGGLFCLRAQGQNELTLTSVGGVGETHERELKIQTSSRPTVELIGARHQSRHGLGKAEIASAFPNTNKTYEMARNPLLDLVVVLEPSHEATDAIFDRSFRLEASVSNQVIDIGVGGRDVAILHRQKFLNRFLP